MITAATLGALLKLTPGRARAALRELVTQNLVRKADGSNWNGANVVGDETS